MSEELPSINDFIENKSELPSVELFTEKVLPIQKSVVENKTEDKITQVIREQPDNTGLIVSLIESVRNSIPEVKSYDKELFEIVNLIEQLKNDIEDSKTEKTTIMESNGYDKDVLREELNDIRNSIPQIPQMPEVRYYDEEIKQLQEAVKKDVDHTSDIKHLQESIHDVKNRSNVDHSWISSTFSSIDENYTTLSSSLATFKGKLEMDVQNIVESIETVSFEDKIDKKNLHERVDETHNLLEEQKASILEKLQETSLNIWNLQKECKDDDSKLQSQINEQYVYLKEGIAAVIEDGDKRYNEVSDRYKEFDVYFKELKEQVEVQHFGLTNTNNNTVQTKESVKALIQSDAITKGTNAHQNQANNTGSTLTGLFLVEYFVNSDGMVHLLCSMQDGNDMVPGDILCILPEGYRPATTDNNSNGYVPVFTAVNSGTNPTITSQWMVKTNGAITCISVSGNSTKFYGQCTFSVYNPN